MSETNTETPTATLETPAPVTETTPTATVTETPKTGATDLDARLAQIEAALDKRNAPVETTKPVETAPDYAALLKEGKRAEAIVALLGDQADDDVLIELAPLLDGKTRREMTIEERVSASLAAAKAADEAKAAEARKTEEAKEQEAADAELTTYMRRGAEAAKTGIASGKYPFLEDYGVDATRFEKLLFKHIDEKKEIPEPDVVLAALEAEHEAHFRKSRLARQPAAPEDPDDVIRRSFADHAAKAPLPVYQPSSQDDDDPARAILAKADHENRTRLGWR